MIRITEIEYVNLIDGLEDSKNELSLNEIGRLKDRFSSIFKGGRVGFSFKLEFENSILLNFNEQTIEIDKFDSLYTIALITSDNYMDVYYTAKNITDIVHNLENLTKTVSQRQRKKYERDY